MAAPFFAISIGRGVLAGTIKGKVTTSDGQPAEFATVVLHGKSSIRVYKTGDRHQYPGE